MRHTLHALVDELRRLKADGVKSITVSEEALHALGRVVRSKTKKFPPAPKAVSPTSELVTEPEESPAEKFTFPAPEKKILVAKPEGADLPPPPVIVLPSGEKDVRWAALRSMVMDDPVCKTHVRPGKKVVFGVGSIDAKIMFVGEAPGAEEEVQGEPFVGPAGQLLTKMILATGLQREEVYIGNIMNWRPQMPANASGVQYGNRPPTLQEMAYCLPYLKAQIEVVNPELIVALGATAAQGLLGAGTFDTLGQVRGKWHEFAGKPLMITYHPSYILRNASNRSKRMIWEDLLKVMERAALPITDKQRGYFQEK